jgi:hypothetical protein
VITIELVRAKRFMSNDKLILRGKPVIMKDEEAETLLSMLDSRGIPYFREVRSGAKAEAKKKVEEASVPV